MFLYEIIIRNFLNQYDKFVNSYFDNFSVITVIVKFFVELDSDKTKINKDN